MSKRNPVARALRSPHLRPKTEPKKKGKGSVYNRSKSKKDRGDLGPSSISSPRNAA